MPERAVGDHGDAALLAPGVVGVLGVVGRLLEDIGGRSELAHGPVTAAPL
jgi:hypothetical protein